MKTSKAHAVWKGNLKKGDGTVKLDTTGKEFNFTFSSRFENEKGTNPEELIAAAHGGCFSMALSGLLSEKGYEPKAISTTTEIKLVKEGDGFKIAESKLVTEAEVPGIDKDLFQDLAKKAKANCPVSQALASLVIKLEAKLKN
jgi:osmotically inducible protein OsmC